MPTDNIILDEDAMTVGRYLLCTVDDNIITITKIRNSYGATQSFIFQIFEISFIFCLNFLSFIDTSSKRLAKKSFEFLGIEKENENFY